MNKYYIRQLDMGNYDIEGACFTIEARNYKEAIDIAGSLIHSETVDIRVMLIEDIEITDVPKPNGKS